MILLANPEIWLVCGSQHLYGPGPLKQVAANAEQIAAGLAESDKLPLKTVFKALLTTPDEITRALPRGQLRRQLRRPHPLDAHLLAVEDVDRRPRQRCASRSCTCTRSSTATCRGARSTWTS